MSATDASSGAVTYSVTSGPATISGNMVTLTGVGTVVLSASQVANGNYTAATASTSFTVTAETPTLAFAAIPAETYGNAPFAAVSYTHLGRRLDIPRHCRHIHHHGHQRR